MKKQVLCDPLDDISKIIVTADDTKSEHNIKMVVIGESGVGKQVLSNVQRIKVITTINQLCTSNTLGRTT